jgi:hypothetical protein
MENFFQREEKRVSYVDKRGKVRKAEWAALQLQLQQEAQLHLTTSLSHSFASRSKAGNSSQNNTGRSSLIREVSAAVSYTVYLVLICCQREIRERQCSEELRGIAIPSVVFVCINTVITKIGSGPFISHYHPVELSPLAIPTEIFPQGGV